ncbi:hypothetical protein D3C72_1642560 [compost metagenome]
MQRVEPAATGGPISIRGSADTIMTAFAQAGIWAVVSITILLWITLHRFADVARTLVPLLVSAIVTLELCVLFGIALNFANVIALPLLLGIGVAFKIYYVIAWRHGKTKLLQSSLTHAVLFSAATTATAFGSLWLSHHPGTASMGKLLALALVTTLAGAVFFQPILMGRPRRAPVGRHDPLGPSLPPLTTTTVTVPLRPARCLPPHAFRARMPRASPSPPSPLPCWPAARPVRMPIRRIRLNR